MALARPSGLVDPLADLVATLSPRAVAFERVSAGTGWAVEFPGTEAITMLMVVRGGCATGGPHGLGPLVAGDVVLLTRPGPLQLSDSVTAPGARVPVRPEESPGEIGVGAGEERTRILVGRYELTGASDGLLGLLLPPVVAVHEPVSDELRDLGTRLAREVSGARPGAALVVERLAELILVVFLRCVPHAGTSPGGPAADATVLRGLADPVVAPALHAVHRDTAARWTVGALAVTAGVSRTVFAERFRRVTGVSPMRYVATWRMALAKDALRRGGRSHEQIARRVGYASPAAFSTAFSHHVGMSPARFVAERRTGVSGPS